MRFYKIPLIVVTALLVILTIAYTVRVSLINNIAKTHFDLTQVKVACLGISLANNLDVIVDRLCLKTPKANIEIVEMKIQWQYSFPIKLTRINIKSANIQSIEPLFSNLPPFPQSNTQQRKSNQSLSQFISTILPTYAKNIKQLQLPMKVNIEKILYSPFIAKNNSKTSRNHAKQKPPYTANLLVVGNTLSFSLQNSKQIAFLKVKLTQNKSDISISISSKLKQLQTFITAHQLPITAALGTALNTHDISGNIDSLIHYQTDSFSMNNQITDLVILSERGISKSSAFKLTGTINVQSQFHLPTEEITFTFIKKNAVSLEYSQPQFFALLEKTKISPAIISLFRDNPLTYLTLSLPDKAKLTLNNEQIKLSGININASGEERNHYVKLEHVSFILPDNRAAMTIKNFIVNSPLILSSLAKFTTDPVVVHLKGSLQSTEKNTLINLTEGSSIFTTNIGFRKEQAKKLKKAKTLLSLKTLSTSLMGQLQQSKASPLNINLKAHSQASQVNIPKTLHIKSFDISSEIKGNLDDININGTVNADQANLGSIKVSGTVLSPKVSLIAKKLPLTDLLSLNIKIPIEINLIDGLLDYSVSGQVTDLDNIENTPFNASVAVTSVSGDVDGIWLQELNWQQDFTILAGEASTLPNNDDNLSVMLIDTPSPISKLSINTQWTFSKGFKLSATKLKANVLGGNFYVPNIQWPFENGHSVNLQLNNIDLEQVVALDKKQGIIVTGNISGQLPVTFDGEKFTIENGNLYNITNGLIQVSDNPMVIELKESNSQLQIAFDALQNLHYHQLSSSVSMANDGYMLLETVIKGRNPDIDNEVNLNLNLSYDLPGLLESLSITERFEKSIIKDLQK